MSAAQGARLSTWQSLRAVTGSWRLLSVALLSFSSGLPLGLVWTAIPTWLKLEGLDIKAVGLLTLTQAPWSFKVLWSPLMDRFRLPLLGGKRGWILVSQAGLLGLSLWFAAVAAQPHSVWAIGALSLATAFVSATHDIAYDAYTVEVLRPEEHGLAVGARAGLYRGAMLFSGGAVITLASSYDVSLFGLRFHWPGTWSLAHLLIAACYLPLMLVTWFAPEPETPTAPPRTLRDAVWGPFVGFLGQHRALEILAFVVLYKLSDQLTQALTRPFLVEVGFGPFDVGVATATIGQAAAVGGTFLGAVLTQRLGLGRSLWIFGFLQIFSNLGYAVVAQAGTVRGLMYAAQGFEHLASGMGTGAFGVLLLRLTEKRFSATQFAMLSSLFTIPRVLAGPPAGVLADALGWRDFFVLTVFTGVPGLMMLARVAPWGVREPEFHVAAVSRRAPLTRAGLLLRAVAATVSGGVAGWLGLGLLDALRSLREGRGFDVAAACLGVLAPRSAGGWLAILGLAALALFVGLAVAATLTARRGLAPRNGIGPAPQA
jgi:PAT family beta-lactamase induction signal transducer AmpG